MSGTLAVATPERVSVELPIAGLGSRAMAWLVDATLLGVVLLALYFAATLLAADPLEGVRGLSRAVRLAAGVALLSALWGYWTVLEVLWQGQTPGKRLVGIRVVQRDGAPVTAVACAVRNLLRLVDFLPACYPVGVITMLIDRQHRRLGDLAAGTVCVREERVDLARYQALGTAVTAVDEVEVATAWLARFEALEPAARLRLGARLAERLGVPHEGADAQALRERIRAKLEDR